MILNTTRCVSSSGCPSSNYPDSATRACQECDSSCMTCSGPDADECLTCNATQALVRTTTGTCVSFSCLDGAFVYINYVAQNVSCQACHSSCKTCSDSGSGNCMECGTGRTAYPSTIANRFYCKSCADLNSGYTLAADQVSCKGKS